MTQASFPHLTLFLNPNGIGREHYVLERSHRLEVSTACWNSLNSLHFKLFHSKNPFQCETLISIRSIPSMLSIISPYALRSFQCAPSFLSTVSTVFKKILRSNLNDILFMYRRSYSSLRLTCSTDTS